MNCDACQSSFGVDDAFCRVCGASVKSVSCPSCKRLIHPDASFCGHCGLRLVSTSPRDSLSRVNHPFSERKLVTILCADLFRSTDMIEKLDPEEAISLLEPPLSAMRHAIRQFRGIVSKEQGDGVVALFGAPIADDDHAVMACHAALELVRRVGLLDAPKVQVRVGLHSGYVVTHTVHGEFTSIYEAGGPAAHMVNRIEQAAEPGQIYVSESCRELADGRLDFLPAPSRQLKGFSQPIQLYRLIGLNQSFRWYARAARGTSRFVGRVAERVALEEAARAAISGPGQIVVVIGDAGIGKSRLVHEFADSLGGWRLIEAEAAPTMLASPYATIRAIFRSLLGNASRNDVGFMPQLHQIIPADFPSSWRTAIDVVLGQPIEDPDWDELDPRSQRRAILKASRWLVQRLVSHNRTVILLEDVHWIDEASEAVIEAIISIADQKDILFILTSRSEVLPNWLSQRRVRSLLLKTLDRGSAEALLDALLGPSPDLAGLKGKVLQHTGNVPLFVEEVVRRLIETGVVTAGNTYYTLAKPLEELGIPPTIQGVIAARIDRRPQQEKSVLQIVSAIGVRADVALISAVAAISTRDILQSLRSLEAAGLLLKSAVTTASVYEFPHDLVREVAYGSILQSDQSRLHERILAALELTSDSRVEGISEALSYHAIRGQVWSKAASYSHISAQKCLARSALADAARYFEMSINATDHLAPSIRRETQAIDLRLEARRAFAAYGKLQRWLELSAEAEERAVAIADEDRVLAAGAVRAAAMNFYSTPIEAIGAGELAVVRAERLGSLDWMSYTEYGLGQAYQTAGYFRRAEQSFSRALGRLAQPEARVPFGSTTSLSLLCLMMKSIAHTCLAEADQAQLCQSQAVDLATSSRHPSDIIAASYGRGFYQLRWGDMAEAHNTLTEVLNLARQNEVRYFVPMIACQLAKCVLMRGDASMAYDILSAAKHEAETAGHTFGVLRASNYLVFVLAQLGDVSSAVKLARSTRLAAEQQGFKGLTAESLFAEAVTLWRDHAGNGEVKALLLSAIEIAAKIEARLQMAAAKEVLAAVLVRDGNPLASRRERDEASELIANVKLTKPFHPIHYI